MSDLIIKTKSEYRFFNALLLEEKMSIKQLRSAVGIDSMHKFINSLRKYGWNIACELQKKASNKFGEPCLYGLFYLGNDEAKDAAIVAVSEWEAAQQ